MNQLWLGEIQTDAFTDLGLDQETVETMLRGLKFSFREIELRDQPGQPREGALTEAKCFHSWNNHLETELVDIDALEAGSLMSLAELATRAPLVIHGEIVEIQSGYFLGDLSSRVRLKVLDILSNRDQISLDEEVFIRQDPYRLVIGGKTNCLENSERAQLKVGNEILILGSGFPELPYLVRANNVFPTAEGQVVAQPYEFIDQSPSTMISQLAQYLSRAN